MYTFHYLHPEGMWGCFCNDQFCAVFLTPEEARAYCDRHNNRIMRHHIENPAEHHSGYSADCNTCERMKKEIN